MTTTKMTTKKTIWTEKNHGKAKKYEDDHNKDNHNDNNHSKGNHYKDDYNKPFVMLIQSF